MDALLYLMCEVISVHVLLENLSLKVSIKKKIPSFESLLSAGLSCHGLVFVKAC